MIWFTSDTHFGHANILRYCGRPFDSIEEHDEELVRRWNALVGDKDDIYHLGDFCFTRAGKSADYYLKKLKGRIHIIWGNHDKETRRLYRHLFASHADYREIYIDAKWLLDEPPQKTKVVLSHYPMRAWNACGHGSFHLWGHEHGNMEPWGLSFDAGVDCHSYRPISVDEVVKKMRELVQNGVKGGFHHNKRDF